MVAQTYDTPDDALDGIVDGITLMVGGFVTAGSPGNLLAALLRRGTRGMTAISNAVTPNQGLDLLFESGQMEKLISTFAIRASGTKQSQFEMRYRAGEAALELVPQGTFSERIRSGGAGIGGFLTPVGLGTPLAEGKTTIEVDGATFLLERPLHADVAFVRAHKADRLGNLQYRMAGRNFNPLMATAADLVIAEVDEIVETGELDPEQIQTPAIFVDRIVQCPPMKVEWNG